MSTQTRPRSTQLWDVLDAAVMEQSIALSFTILRKISTAHGGHESSTEGDSIILGFHSPLVALRASLEAQEALLIANWPEQLLDHPLCKPQYALPARGTDTTVSHSHLPPLMLAVSSFDPSLHGSRTSGLNHTSYRYEIVFTCSTAVCSHLHSL
jgi:hypothetical protein